MDQQTLGLLISGSVGVLVFGGLIAIFISERRANKRYHAYVDSLSHDELRRHLVREARLLDALTSTRHQQPSQDDGPALAAGFGLGLFF